MPYFNFFGGAEIWKNYCHIWNQPPWICVVAKFSAKVQIFNFEIKNACSGYFFAGISK